MTALEKLVRRCNEMDITEQMNWLGDAIMPGQAARELAALVAERDALRTAYHQLWSKHGDLAERTVDEVLAARPAAGEEDG